MWKLLSNTHRSLLGGFRASLRDDYQTVQGQRVLGILHGSGICPLSSSNLCASTCPEGLKDFDSKELLDASHFRRENKGQEDGNDGWNLFEAFHYSTALALTYNLVHQQKENSRLSDYCPLVAYTDSTCLLAQPRTTNLSKGLDLSSLNLEALNLQPSCRDKLSQPHLDVLDDATQPQRVVLDELSQTQSGAVECELSRKPVKFYLSDHDSEADADESQADAATDDDKDDVDCHHDASDAAKRVLSPTEEFELELDTMEGVQLLEEGNLRGISCLQAQSRRGSSVASFYLGMAYEQGHLVQRNLITARIYYEMAAERGNPEAQYNLAVFYAEGRGGLQRDEVRATQLLRQAADGGSSDARQALGLDQSQGQEVKQPEYLDGTNLYMLGRSFESLGETKVALDFYTLAVNTGYTKAKRAKERLSDL